MIVSLVDGIELLSNTYMFYFLFSNTGTIIRNLSGKELKKKRFCFL